ncbi:four helix bundle protein [Candidatus Margulisiibacteriota bacterium]
MDKPYSNFPVYKKALAAAKEVNLLCKCVEGRDFYFLKDQLRRAASSIVLNIAEGSGKWTKRDKVNFYRIARASAFECVGALDLISIYQLVEQQNKEKLKNELVKIAGEIQALIFGVEKRDNK